MCSSDLPNLQSMLLPGQQSPTNLQGPSPTQHQSVYPSQRMGSPQSSTFSVPQHYQGSNPQFMSQTQSFTGNSIPPVSSPSPVMNSSGVANPFVNQNSPNNNQQEYNPFNAFGPPVTSPNTTPKVTDSYHKSSIGEQQKIGRAHV